MSNNAPYKGSPAVGGGSGPYKQSPPSKPPVKPKPAPSGSGPYKGGSGPYRK